MKKVVWLLLLCALVVVPGCKKNQVTREVRKIRIAVKEQAVTVKANNSIPLEGYVVRDKYYYGFNGSGTGVCLVATYEENGVIYRLEEPIAWKTDNPEIADLEPIVAYGECMVHQKKLGKMTVTATAQNGTKDTVTVHVVPDFRYKDIPYNRPFGLKFDDAILLEQDSESWYFSMLTENIAEAGMFFHEYGKIEFPYGYVDLNQNYYGTLSAFGDIDPNIEIGTETMLLNKTGGWFVFKDRTGRKIAMCLASGRERISYMAWHVLQEAPAEM